MTNQITYLFLETHDKPAAVRFWEQVGYEVDFDLGASCRMVNSAGGPSLFLTEKPADQEVSTQISIRTNLEGWRPEPPIEVVEDWHDSHWGTKVMKIRDPDGREMLVQLNGD